NILSQGLIATVNPSSSADRRPIGSAVSTALHRRTTGRAPLISTDGSGPGAAGDGCVGSAESTPPGYLQAAGAAMTLLRGPAPPDGDVQCRARPDPRDQPACPAGGERPRL